MKAGSRETANGTLGERRAYVFVEMKKNPEDDAAEEEEIDKVDDEISGDGDGDDGEGKVEYVKKQFVARPWVTDSGVYEDMMAHKITQTRPLHKVRVSKPRKEFADTGLSIVDKDSGDMQSVCQEFKPQFQKGFNYMERDRRKVLHIGLQAAS